MSERGPDPKQAKRQARKRTPDDEARWALEASEKLYYRIGEVSERTGVKAHVLRYWETEFRWMAPPKSRSKQRLYRRRDIEFVWLLKRLLWEERYTIAGARQRIQELGVEKALALLGRGPTGTATDDSGASPAHTRGTSAETEASRVRPRGDWSDFGRELGELHGELSSLRALLQERA